MIRKSDIIKLAYDEVGYLEKKSNANLYSKTGNAGRNNFTKYWKELEPKMNGSAWCQCFINYLFEKVGGRKEAQKILLCGNTGYTYYTPAAVVRAEAAGQWHDGVAEIQPGDIVYFYGYVKSEDVYRVHHVGLCVKVQVDKIITIEGNTASGQGVIDNGGQVAIKTYPIDDKNIYGYFRPKYDPELETDEMTGWHKDGTGWWYRHTEGKGPSTYYHSGIFMVNGLPYAFDKNGYVIYDIGKIAIHPEVGAIYVR